MLNTQTIDIRPTNGTPTNVTKDKDSGLLPGLILPARRNLNGNVATPHHMQVEALHNMDHNIMAVHPRRPHMDIGATKGAAGMAMNTGRVVPGKVKKKTPWRYDNIAIQRETPLRGLCRISLKHSTTVHDFFL